MFTAIKAFFISKTTWAAVLGSAVVMLVAMLLPHLPIPDTFQPEIIGLVGGLFGLKPLQQAFADFGKNAAATSPTTGTTTPTSPTP